MRTLIIVGLFTAATIIGTFPGPAWGCAAGPFWQDTLRCELFPEASQTPPHPPTVPAVAGDIKDFTRVNLPWRNEGLEVVRCVDGTRPVIYIDEAVSATSNRWVFTFQGGGSCNGGQACLETYLDAGEQAEMSTARKPAMKNMQGIHRATASNSFADYHRIRIEKCGYDRYNGNATLRGLDATADSDLNANGIQSEVINDPGGLGHDPLLYSIREGAGLTFDLFHHGKKIVLHTLDQLRDGMPYDTWIDSGGLIVTDSRTMPPLKEAEVILFAGHSGGAHGLMNNIDDLVDYMSGWTRGDGSPFDADVRALFDAHLLPALESEAAFNEHLSGDVYDQLTLCRSPCESGPPLHYSYDGMAYFASGGFGVGDYFDGPYREWNVPLDASCLAAHPSDDWRCADRFHVLFNHISTPFFIREDFGDPNGQHNDNPAGPENHGHRLSWAESRAAYCEDRASTEPCPPVLSPADFRARVEEQAKRLARDFDTRSELALGGSPVPTVFLWLPDCAAHAGAFDDQQFFDVELESRALAAMTNMHDFLEDFMNGAATGAFASRIDGDGDLRSICR